MKNLKIFLIVFLTYFFTFSLFAAKQTAVFKVKGMG